MQMLYRHFKLNIQKMVLWLCFSGLPLLLHSYISSSFFDDPITFKLFEERALLLCMTSSPPDHPRLWFINICQLRIFQICFLQFYLRSRSYLRCIPSHDLSLLSPSHLKSFSTLQDIFLKWQLCSLYCQELHSKDQAWPAGHCSKPVEQVRACSVGSARHHAVRPVEKSCLPMEKQSREYLSRACLIERRVEQCWNSTWWNWRPQQMSDKLNTPSHFKDTGKVENELLIYPNNFILFLNHQILILAELPEL